MNSVHFKLILWLNPVCRLYFIIIHYYLKNSSINKEFWDIHIGLKQAHIKILDWKLLFHVAL